MSPDRGLDRLLDRSVVLGYSKLGVALRRRRWSPDPRPDALRGCRAVVTGAGGGLGEATALGLARLGATVHVLARSSAKAEAARDRISSSLAEVGVAADLHAEVCDVANFSSVRRFTSDFVARLASSDLALDVLVHNAGVMPEVRTESTDGHELTMATHVLGPILMTEQMRPVLRKSQRGARTIFVSSGGQYTQKLPAEDPEFAQGDYRGSVAYARSKRMQVELTPILAAHWAGATAVYSMHPGWADTPGVVQSLPGFHALTRPLLRSAADGADTVVWLAGTDPSPQRGTFWHDRRERPINYLRRTSSSRAEVDEAWDWVRAELGLRQGE